MKGKLHILHNSSQHPAIEGHTEIASDRTGILPQFQLSFCYVHSEMISDKFQFFLQFSVKLALQIEAVGRQHMENFLLHPEHFPFLSIPHIELQKRCCSFYMIDEISIFIT